MFTIFTLTLLFTLIRNFFRSSRFLWFFSVDRNLRLLLLTISFFRFLLFRLFNRILDLHSFRFCSWSTSFLYLVLSFFIFIIFNIWFLFFCWLGRFWRFLWRRWRINCFTLFFSWLLSWTFFYSFFILCWGKPRPLYQIFTSRPIEWIIAAAARYAA